MDTTRDTVGDLQRKFNGSYVEATIKDVKIPFLVSDVVRSDRDVVFVGVPNGKKREIVVRGGDVECWNPRLGVINLGPTAAFVTQTAPRQWRWGMHSDLLKLDYVAKEVSAIAKVEDFLRTQRHYIIKELFSPAYFPLDKAYARVINGSAVVRAVDSKYWVGVAPFSELPVLGYKQWYVGTMPDANTVSLSPRVAHLAPEIRKYCEVV